MRIVLVLLPAFCLRSASAFAAAHPPTLIVDAVNRTDDTDYV